VKRERPRPHPNHQGLRIQMTQADSVHTTLAAICDRKVHDEALRASLGVVGVQLFQLSPSQRRRFLDGVLPRKCGGTHPT
jgi:hypothetical protein